MDSEIAIQITRMALEICISNAFHLPQLGYDAMYADVHVQSVNLQDKIHD